LSNAGGGTPIDYFGKDLLTKEGLKETTEVVGGKKLLGLYFSAHWVKVYQYEMQYATILTRLILYFSVLHANLSHLFSPSFIMTVKMQELI
jgi:hypothetical protein